jgi:hypothetical protein
LLALEERLGQVFNPELAPKRAIRAYTWNGTQPSDMGRAGEQAIHAILSARERGETISQLKKHKVYLKSVCPKEEEEL